MTEAASNGGAEEQGDRDPVEFGAETPLLEWAIAGVGLVLAVALVATLLHAGLTGTNGPPAFATDVVEVEVQQDVALLEVEVTNDGGSGAQAVVVRAETAGGEVAQATIGQLPRGATQTVGLLVPAPDAARAEVRVVGYVTP